MAHDPLASIRLHDFAKPVVHLARFCKLGAPRSSHYSSFMEITSAPPPSSPAPPNDIRLHARGHVINIFHRPSILDAALITLQLRRGSHCNPRPTIGKSSELAAPCDKRYNFRGPFGDRNIDSLAENGVVIERTWQIFGVNALFTESRAWWIHPLAVWSELREWIFEGVFARWAAL